MTEIKIITTQFGGGISNNSKTGQPATCSFSRNLSIFEDGDSCTLQPTPVKDSAATVTGLVKWIVDATPYNTNRYAYDDAGNIYKIASNVWSLDRAVATGGAAGQGLVVLNNTLYYMTSTTVGQNQYLDNSPAYNDDVFTDGTTNLDQSNTTATGQTYTTPTSISEGATARLTFTPTRDPLKAVILKIAAVGTGNWTVTIHDAGNVSIGSVTVANGSLTTGNNTFTFATPLRFNLGRTYHLHITSTVADGTVTTATTADLTTAYYQTLFGILIADTEYHPAIQHTDGTRGNIVIANEHYMATWNGITYNPNAIECEPGYKIRGWARENEFIVGYAWKGINIDSFEEGRMFYWDGIQPYYNYSKPVPSGLPNAAISSKNRMFSILGSSGDLALGTEPFKQLQPAPKLTRGYKVEVMPGAITNWQRRVQFGYGNTTDPNTGTYNYATGVAPAGIEQGVYEFGDQSDRAVSYTSVSSEGLNFAFSPSTAIATPSSFKVGCVAAFGKDLYISYKDGSTYYVDRVNKANNPCANGSWESLIIDEGLQGQQLASMPQKQKTAVRLVITFATLPTGCTVTPKFKAERAANWTLGTAAVVGATRALYNFSTIGGLRYKEIAVGFDLAATVNFPIITGVYFEFDAREKEDDSL